MEVYPGDKIVIHKAVLWLGAAAVFYLPLLVIPLRSLENQRGRQHWFPEVGYNSYEGAWIKIQIPFGKDQYYYGYYIVNYYTHEGLGLGYVGFYASKKGRRSASINVYTINNRQAGGRQTNAALPEQENFSDHLRSNFQFSYQSNYGPLITIPPNESLSEAIVHQTAQTSQNYSSRTPRSAASRAATASPLPTRVSSIKISIRRLPTTSATATRALAASDSVQQPVRVRLPDAVHDVGRRLSDGVGQDLLAGGGGNQQDSRVRSAADRLLSSTFSFRSRRS